MSIGKRISERRKQLGLSASELAKKIGVSTSAVTNYESDRNGPKSEQIPIIAEVLGVDANYLFQDDFNPAAEAEREKLITELFNNAQALNEQGIKQLVQLLGIAMLPPDRFQKILDVIAVIDKDAII